MSFKKIFKRSQPQIDSHSGQDIERFNHGMPAGEHSYDGLTNAERQTGLHGENDRKNRACEEHRGKQIGEDPESTPFVPVNPGKALGDLAGIAEIRQHKFFDLILTATRLARRDNEVLNMAAK